LADVSQSESLTFDEAASARSRSTGVYFIRSAGRTGLHARTIDYLILDRENDVSLWTNFKHGNETVLRHSTPIGTRQVAQGFAAEGCCKIRTASLEARRSGHLSVEKTGRFRAV
jgi:hypothetical protein